MALISSAASPRQRGGFNSVLTSVQQFAAALASFLAGFILTKDGAGRLVSYGYVGWNAVIFSLIAIFVITKVRQSEH
jgi:MFS family permease